MKHYHSHPSGMRFVRREAANRKPIEIIKKLGVRGNGWHSWRDVDRESADFGLWVLFNVSTEQTYVEKRYGRVTSRGRGAMVCCGNDH